MLFMKKLNIDLENCYGIKKLNSELDFSDKNVIAIYAPNGVMKTSFAKTFKDLMLGNKTADRIYTDRVTKREIKNEKGIELTPAELFVIEPYDAEYKSDKVSTLLVNKKLRQEYEDIYKEIDLKKQNLLKKIKKISGYTKEKMVEEIFSQDISNKKDFFTALKRIKDEVNEYIKNPKGLESIIYSSVFNDESIDLLNDPNIIQDLTKYIETYDKLLETSTFFRKGVFNHNNAAETAKRLNENGWFKANHSVNIKINNEEKKISNIDELEAAITSEKENIINNLELQDAFEKLDKTLVKTKAKKEFRDYIEKNKDILPELKEPAAFREKLWIAYLAQNKAEYDDLLALYDESKEKIQIIVTEAEKQSTKWQEVINEFNDRYSVPFRLKMANQSDVILSDMVPVIKFDFIDGEEERPVERDLLLNILSQGEKRALYILNIIFEVEARRATNQETLFIIDDIADSFDYKNKYAIIEYLKDIAKIKDFSLIILTHNFDFHRNACGRIGVLRKNRFYATKYSNEIKLEQEKYQKNPFHTWKKFQNVKHEIAAIPFVRNLAEFCDEADANDVFKDLTCLLHQKAKTPTITMKDLSDIFRKLITIPAGANFFGNKNAEDRIYELANSIVVDVVETMELEDKVILSIAIRLKAEKFMIAKINDANFVAGITEDQTRILIDEFKRLFPTDKRTISLLDKVNLMTPENIHINSFMYEPILDMSNEHLKKLYTNISALII